MISIHYIRDNFIGGCLVHYTSWDWDLWDEPSDCDWIVPGTLDLGGQQ